MYRVVAMPFLGVTLLCETLFQMVKKTTKAAAPAKKVEAKKVVVAPVAEKRSMPEVMATPAAKRSMTSDASCMNCGRKWVWVIAILLVANLIATLVTKSAIRGNEELKVGGHDNYQTLLELYKNPQFSAMQKQQIEGALQQMQMMSAQSGATATPTTTTPSTTTTEAAH